MPNVAGKKFPYTPKGEAAAKSVAKKTGKRVLTSDGFMPKKEKKETKATERKEPKDADDVIGGK